MEKSFNFRHPFQSWTGLLNRICVHVQTYAIPPTRTLQYMNHNPLFGNLCYNQDSPEIRPEGETASTIPLGDALSILGVARK